MFEGLSRFAENVLFPINELLLEILKLTLVHEHLVLGRTIHRPLSQNFGCLHGHSEPPKLPVTRGALIANGTSVSISGNCFKRLGCTAGLLELGDFDRRAQFDIIEHRLQSWVLRQVALITDGAAQAVQIGAAEAAFK